MNIAEILKYCPKGTKLYSIIFGEVKLDEVCNNSMIKVIIKNNNSRWFYEDGSFSEYGEGVLFPSKDQRDWKKFKLPVKDGDIMMTIDKRAFITNGKIDNDGCPCAYCGINSYHDFTIGTTTDGWTASFYIPVSEEAKKELFDKMAEAGYRWNADTLELEKIEPKFKEGDVVINSKGYLFLVSAIKDVDSIVVSAVLYTKGALNTYHNPVVMCYTTEVTLASIKDKNRFYSALVREGYKYNKWQHKLIKQEFKPFDKVLVRGNDTEFWKADIYLGYMKNNSCPYRCTKANYGRCIPYEGNEYLLDTANSPTWIDKKE